MTYFGILLRFLVIPIILLLALHGWAQRGSRGVTTPSHPLAPWKALALLVIVALIYTTPWDNYLVATGVWYYDPALVTGITLGWVPIEEYTFFVLQPIFTGLILFWLLRRFPLEGQVSAQAGWLRQAPAFLLGGIGILMTAILVAGWKPGTYLALELVWVVPPLILQLVFGADILWQARRPVLLTITFSTLYLAVVDALAIESGTWTIDPEQSLNIFLGGVLPIEELVFFLITNVMVVFGLTLLLSPASRSRLPVRRAADGSAPPSGAPASQA